MIHIDKNQLGEIIHENRRPVESEELPIDVSVIVHNAAETYGFTIDEENLKKLTMLHWIPQPPYDGAVIVVRGTYTVDPTFQIVSDSGKRVPVKTFVFHQTEVDAHNRRLAQTLIDEKMVTLQEGLDAEYLYEVLSDTTDTYFYETIRKYADTLPLYEIVFDAKGSYKITDLGKVEPI